MPGRRHQPMRSKAQWRYLFARARYSPKFRKIAHDKAHATKGGPRVRYRRLPTRKGAPSARTARKRRR